ncbi:hypothetical protein PR003_g19511 [Phytophthora rubi]|uniref:HTH CENPB-type domain-containing protein n=1 Tax=Phytophthora rubi TaxID=129364 RepID=A0A6A4DYM9_9STRA|nr:hypothetical protein PR003_g19511 [Phytophthora rubi]
MPSSRMANSMAEKKEVVQWIEKNAGAPTPSAAFFKDERGWKVSEDQVRKWWKQRTATKAAPALCSRLSGAGAKPRLPEIEDILFDQVLFCRSAKEKVCRDWIRDAGFFASDRWVNGFTRRYGMSLRRTTNLAVLTDDVLTDRAVSFLSYLTSRMDGLSDDHIILIDETAVYFENPRRQTMDQVGARHGVLRSTGFASMRVTTVLAVTATGRKLPPLVVWKGAKQDDKIERYGNVYVVNQPKEWVESALLTRGSGVSAHFPHLHAGKSAGLGQHAGTHLQDGEGSVHRERGTVTTAVEPSN